MSGQQRQREGWRRGEGKEEHKFSAATVLAGGRQKRGGKKWERGLRCSADRLAFEKQQGPSEGQRAAECGVQSGPESYIIEWSHAVTQISGEINHSARVTGGQSREHI